VDVGFGSATLAVAWVIGDGRLIRTLECNLNLSW
jgi:hypothetical protein